MPYDDRIIEQLTSGDVKSALLAHFDFKTNPQRLWTGVGPIQAVAPGDPAIHTWTGVGTLGKIEGVAQRGDDFAVEEIKFAISAASPAMALSYASDASETRRRMVYLYEIFFDDDWSLIDGLAAQHVFEGQMGSPTIAQPKRKEDELATRVMTVTASNVFVNRNRPALRYWSDRDQKSRSSDDAICERMLLYASGREIIWPIF